jgi:polysaccharide transporter, PST family
LSILALAAMFQPVNAAAGWLFISQGRSAHLMSWGFISAPLQILAIFCGLPWGPVGVAVAYVTMEILVITPILWRRVGSPLFSARDIAGTIGPFLACSAVTAAGLFYLRHVLPALPSLALLGLALVFAYAIQLAILTLSPRHRIVLVRLIRLARQAIGG